LRTGGVEERERERYTDKRRTEMVRNVTDKETRIVSHAFYIRVDVVGA
jgi:hypothetical protein